MLKAQSEPSELIKFSCSPQSFVPDHRLDPETVQEFH